MTRKTLLLRLALIPAVAIVGLGGAIAFGTAKPPPPMPSIDGKAAIDGAREPLPSLSRFNARDGTALAYRAYRPSALAVGAPVAVLIHGSTGSSVNMNIVANALAARGVPAYSPDIRGHGASGERGDIDHIGQLEDDLTDLVSVIHRDYPGARIVLAGHSSGGGFVLRAAAEPQGRQFSRFVLLAPYLGEGRPTTQPAAGGWNSAYVPRIVGLALLNRVGVTALNGLPTVAFATSPGRPTQTWSYRLMLNFGPPGLTKLHGDPILMAAKAAHAPITVVAGAKDESMVPSAYPQAFAGVTPAVRVTILPGVGHMDLLSAPTAVPAVVDAITG